MKKSFYVFVVLLFIAINVFSQNIDNQNKGFQINPPDNIINDDIPNQQVVMNNMPQAEIQQQSQVVNYIQQKQSNENVNDAKPTINIGASNQNEKVYVSYSSPSYSSKHHYKKSKINLHKIHILRKFRNECPVFKAKTYKKLFSSKKRIIKHCSHF